ncbi:Methyl sulfide methyltransferase-associated sensor [uncultured archaeon]|nr:Methyl sulfide methyltransferase-associated sensor [uncultured archaeon]
MKKSDEEPAGKSPYSAIRREFFLCLAEEDAVKAVTRGLLTAFDADVVYVALIDGDVFRITSASRVGVLHEGSSWVVSSGKTPVLKGVLGKRGSVFFDALAADDALFSKMKDSLIRSVWSAPLEARESTLGVVAVGYRKAKTEKNPYFDEAVLDAGAALDNARRFEDLRRLNEAKDNFIASISGELNSSLTDMLRYVNLLVQPHMPQNKRRAYVDVVSRSGSQIRRIVQDLVDLSGRRGEKIELALKPIDVGGVLYEVQRETEVVAAEKNIPVCFIMADNLPRVVADRDRLKQILHTLIGNAIKHTPNGGSVTVSAKKDLKFILFRVEDTGKVVPLQLRPLIFKKFMNAGVLSGDYRLEMSLPVAKELAEYHGGNVWYEEGKKGESMFILRIPAEPAPLK